MCMIGGHTIGRRARSLLVDEVLQPPPPADAGNTERDKEGGWLES